MTRRIYHRAGRPPIEAEVDIEQTDHPDLYIVRVSGHHIGSIRRMGDLGWMPLGAFALNADLIPDYSHHYGALDHWTHAPKDGVDLPNPAFYNGGWRDRDKAVEALVNAWVDALTLAIRRLKRRDQSRQCQYDRRLINGHKQGG